LDGCRLAIIAHRSRRTGSPFLDRDVRDASKRRPVSRTDAHDWAD
jgi:hypothetical protein